MALADVWPWPRATPVDVYNMRAWSSDHLVGLVGRDKALINICFESNYNLIFDFLYVFKDAVFN